MVEGMTTNAFESTFKRIQVPKGISGTMFYEVVTAASAAYNVKRNVPSVDEISRYTHATPRSISKVISSTEFKELMRARGYNFDGVAKLSPEQYFAVSVITNASDRRPLNAKLKSAGITYAQYRGWLKQPHFRDYVAKIGEDMLGEHVQDIHTRVIERASSGDMQAVKLYYELSGRLDPTRQQNIDVANVIKLLLEIITRYVTDVGTLARINADISAVLSGQTPENDDFNLERIRNSHAIEGEIVNGERPDTQL